MGMDLRQDIQAAIIALAQEYGLEQVILFGSRARGDNWERSDIDLAVRGGDVIRFSLDLDDRVPTLLLFDVVDLGGAVDPDLLVSIQREGRKLYEKS